MIDSKPYDGVAGLEPRKRSPLFALSIGLKRQTIAEWQKDHPDYKIPRDQYTKKGGILPVLYKDPDSRFFIKTIKGQGPPGSRPIDRYRLMAPGFEVYNLDSNGDPAGQRSFYGFLPAGKIERHDNGRVKVPYFQRERRAQILGRKEGFKTIRLPTYNPPRGREAPSNLPECRGNGVKRTRWEPDEQGRWAFREGECLGDDCPFAEVCKISMSLALFSDADACGQQALVQYENKSANSTAFVEGFFTRLRDEMDRFEMDGEAYGLPVRLEISMESKGAGKVRGIQLGPRRFPVVRIGELRLITAHRQALAQMLTAGGGALALPVAPPQLAAAPEEIAEGDADLTPDPEPPKKPRLVAAPEPEEIIIEGKEVAEKPSAPATGLTLAEKIGLRAKELLGIPDDQKADKKVSARINSALRGAKIIGTTEQWHKIPDGREEWPEIDAVLQAEFS